MSQAETAIAQQKSYGVCCDNVCCGDKKNELRVNVGKRSLRQKE